MRLRLSLVLTSLVTLSASCGKSDAPAADTNAPPPKVEPTAPTPDSDTSAVPKECVSHEVAKVIGGLDPELARIEGTGVEVCGLLGEARKCVVTDLASGTRSVLDVDDDDVDRLPDYPAGFSDGIIRDDKRPVVKICLSAETGCKDLHTGQVLSARFDAARERVVLTTLDDGKKAKVYDTATLELKQSFDIGEGTLPDCTFATFVGARLLVSSGACTGGGKSWLLDPATGEKVADIGGDAPIFVKDGHLVATPQAGENAWAFRSADGDAVVLQDVASGAVLGRLNLKDTVGDTTPKYDGAWILNHELGLVLVESRPLPDSLYVVDAKTMKVEKTLMPRPCE